MKQTTSQKRKSRYTRSRRMGTRRMEKSDQLPKAYQVVTDKIVSLLEQGVVPWHRPWKSIGLPKNLHSGKSYRGINSFLLHALGAAQGYSSPYWITFKQALDRGGNVRKGEHGSPVVFWKLLDSKSDAEDDTEPEDGNFANRRVPLIRYSTVFNVEQCEGIEYPTPVALQPSQHASIEACESLIAAMPNAPQLIQQGDRAFYRPSTDSVTVPPMGFFESPEAYYCTLFHELAHATGHEKRLNRSTIMSSIKFGSPEYAREELIAEMGAAFLCHQTGIDPVTLDNTAAYLNNWITVLRGNPKLVVLAASQAQKAAEYICNHKETAELSAPVASNIIGLEIRQTCR
ncbi:MAG: zincin-like metallopeptidase domain-containing protein [Candidatus Sumerlaeia bacterium]|nr:zincin-like metallopeptidase domain-containing protein [Candidatus Sumerlaeia bacterium]